MNNIFMTRKHRINYLRAEKARRTKKILTLKKEIAALLLDIYRLEREEEAKNDE